jgi:hypothetical protein
MFHIWWKTFAFVALLEPWRSYWPLTSRLKAIFQLTRNQPYVEARAYIEFATAFNKTKLSHFFSLRESGHERTPDVSRLLPHAGFVDAVTSAHKSKITMLISS